MAPEQAAQILGSTGITPDNFMQVKMAMDAIAPLLMQGMPGGPAAGGPPAPGGGAPPM